MRRYIDADELYRKVKTETNPYGKPTLDYESGIKVLNMINRAPTVDVVPRSEVDILKSLIAHKEEEAYNKGYEDGTVDNGVPRYEGYWLKTDAYPHRVYCSVCYKTYVTNEEIIHGRSHHNYCYCTEAEFCPHCGAKMKGGGEE